ncbi:MAG: hypothetical protein ACKVOU_01660 [Cytophagales bacterium]
MELKYIYNEQGKKKSVIVPICNEPKNNEKTGKNIKISAANGILKA